MSHSLLTGQALLLGLAALVVSVLLVVVVLLLPDGPTRYGGVLADAVAVAGLAALVLAAARGATSIGTTTDARSDPLLPLLPLLVALVAGVAVARLLGPAMRLLERRVRGASAAVRIAVVSVAREPLPAAIAGGVPGRGARPRLLRHRLRPDAARRPERPGRLRGARRHHAGGGPAAGAAAGCRLAGAVPAACRRHRRHAGAAAERHGRCDRDTAGRHHRAGAAGEGHPRPALAQRYVHRQPGHPGAAPDPGRRRVDARAAADRIGSAAPDRWM